MDFVGFSFHFANDVECRKALAEVEKMENGRAGKGIDSSSIQRLAGGFYIGWNAGVQCSAARSWLLRIPAKIDRSAKGVKMCGHHSTPPPGQLYDAMVPLPAALRGSRCTLTFYHIPPVVGEPAVANGWASHALVVAAASSSAFVQTSRLPEVAAAAPGATDIIQATSACWTLSLFRRDQTLNSRSNLYTVGTKLGEGSHGVVFNLTFHGCGRAKLCAKMLRSDDTQQRKSRIEVYALERCNESPSGIIRLLDVFVKFQNQMAFVYLVMEKWDMDLNAFIRQEVATPIQIRSALRGPVEGLHFLHDRLLLVHCDVASKNILVRMNMVAAVPDIVAVLGDLGSVAEVCNYRLPLVYFSGGARDSAQKHFYCRVGGICCSGMGGGMGRG
jgi:hypothetical protein